MTAKSAASEFSARIDQIRSARKPPYDEAEIEGIVGNVLETLSGDFSAVNVTVHQEIQELLTFIRNAKSEIAAIRPQDINDLHIPVATDELDAVIKATEEATDCVLDAAERLSDMAGEVDDKTGEQLTEIVTRIYEASNFQDITGQRISKVVATLRHIEETVGRVAGLLNQSSDERTTQTGTSADATEIVDAATDDAEAGLLNGPQMPDSANSQDEIDALLASFD
jgi:chemotaxis protein CheZ